MEYRDYYAVLGLPRSATPAEIKKAYRKLARQVHPDVKPGDAAAEKRFKEINEAHEVLSDPGKRKRYDTLGANWDTIRSAGGGDPFGPGGPFAGYRAQAGGPGGVRYEFRTGGGGPGDFSDFFTFFFGGGAEAAARSGRGGARTRSAEGGFDDLLAQLGLNTTGSAAGSGGPGRGRTAAPRDVTADVEVSLEEAFHGTTRLVEVDGRRLEVKVPRGVATGSRVRLAGQGGDSRDLILVMRVRPHGTFRRHGDDLERDLRVTLAEALLGAEVPVTTLKGRLLLRIPAGSQAGRRIRLAGQGMPHLKGSGTGDLYVVVSVVLPSALTPEAEQAARAFLELARQPDPRT